MMGINYGYPSMMGGNWGSASNVGLFGFLGTATWIALFLFLVLGAIYFWKGIMKRDRR